MERDTLGYIFLVLFGVLVLYSGFHNTEFTMMIASGTLQGLIYYIISNPAYIIIFAGVLLSNQAAAWKEILAALALIWAFDIVSFPRLPSEALPTDVNFLANSDAIFIEKLNSILQLDYSTMWNFYYIILPLLLVGASAWLLGIRGLGGRVKKGA